MKENHSAIKDLFEPESVAVIGASATPGKIGHTIVRNLISGGFKGKIYPVNPQGGEILGHEAFRDLNVIPGVIDVVSIVIPAKLCVDAVEKCAARGVKHVQIITSGFSEVGNMRDEHKMALIAKEAGMRILGPNIFGMYSARASMNATFSATGIIPGNVAILTQSGALGIAMIGKTTVENLGLSAIVSLGNKCDIDEADLLEYLAGQDETKVILMYIEGVKDGERLIETLKTVAKGKPVIAIKSGRSKRGAMAAASHTGSLAGSDGIFDAVMRQAGVMRAETLEEAFSWAKYLSVCPEPRGDRAVIVTNGGGIGVLATDACEKYGVGLFDDQETLKKVFGPATPPFGSTKNPVDITGGAKAGDYTLALSAPAESAAMDATIALYCETATFDSENLVPMIKDSWQKHLTVGKPITYAIVGGESVEKAMGELRRENVPVFGDVNPAVSCLGTAYRWFRRKNRKEAPAEEIALDAKGMNAIIDSVLSQGRNFLLADEARAIMKIAGIPMPASRIAKNIREAVFSAGEIGYPLVMKIVSRDIIHKSDAGGIALNLENADEVMSAYEAIIHNCLKYNPSAVIDGIELAEMARPGLELVIGAVRDSSFGPVVMCGLGGIYVEVMKDVMFRSFPLNREEALNGLKEIRSFPLLMGVRGEARKDIESVIDTILKVGAILSRCGRITDIEINPAVVYEQGKGIRALDVRILCRKPREESHE